MSELTHLDSGGRRGWSTSLESRATERRARARAVVRVSPETARKVRDGDTPKGDVLGVARIAGIQAAKRTSELIPLCHPLGLSFIGVEGIDRRRRARSSSSPRPAPPVRPGSRWRR